MPTKRKATAPLVHMDRALMYLGKRPSLGPEERAVKRRATVISSLWIH